MTGRFTDDDDVHNFKKLQTQQNYLLIDDYEKCQIKLI